MCLYLHFTLPFHSPSYRRFGSVILMYHVLPMHQLPTLPSSTSLSIIFSLHVNTLIYSNPRVTWHKEAYTLSAHIYTASIFCQPTADLLTVFQLHFYVEKHSTVGFAYTYGSLNPRLSLRLVWLMRDIL